MLAFDISEVRVAVYALSLTQLFELAAFLDDEFSYIMPDGRPALTCHTIWSVSHGADSKIRCSRTYFNTPYTRGGEVSRVLDLARGNHREEIVRLVRGRIAQFKETLGIGEVKVNTEELRRRIGDLLYRLERGELEDLVELLGFVLNNSVVLDEGDVFDVRNGSGLYLGDKVYLNRNPHANAAEILALALEPDNLFNVHGILSETANAFERDATT